MPWVLLVLYGAGISMAWHYRSVLAHPMDSTFATLLTLKIVLALSVLGHFITAMVLGSKGLLQARYVQRIHIIVFTHMIVVLILAKTMMRSEESCVGKVLVMTVGGMWWPDH